MKAYEYHPIMKKALQTLSVDIPKECIGIHGKLYDVQTFHEIHPGGAEWILTCKGTDATSLFETMHINSEMAALQLQKIPCIGTYTCQVNWNYESYRKLKSDVLDIFPTISSRKNTTFRFTLWCTLTLVLHIYLISHTEFHIGWYICVFLSGLCNSVIGGFGHNYLHRLDIKSMSLDWNGLSSFEWILEHVVSHHCHPNTNFDHDSISMLPFVDWNKKYCMNVLIFPIFAIGEIIVAIQGYIGHRCRWYPYSQKGFSTWMQYSPYLFLFRIASHFIFQPPLIGFLSILLTLMTASFYFSYLAHLNHAFQASKTNDFLDHQLGSTGDLKSLPIFNDLLLGLDRQTLHHLFPTIDHSLLDDNLRNFLKNTTKKTEFVQHSFFKMNHVMFERLF